MRALLILLALALPVRAFTLVWEPVGGASYTLRWSDAAGREYFRSVGTLPRYVLTTPTGRMVFRVTATVGGLESAPSEPLVLWVVRVVTEHSTDMQSWVPIETSTRAVAEGPAHFFRTQLSL